jgi:hypothetical protein
MQIGEMQQQQKQMVVFGTAQCSKHGKVCESAWSTDRRCSSDVKLKFQRWQTAGLNVHRGEHVRFYARWQSLIDRVVLWVFFVGVPGLQNNMFGVAK